MNGTEKRYGFIINVLYYATIVFLVLLFVKYLLSPFLPFVTAFIIVSASRRLLLGLEEKARSRKFAWLLFTLLLVLVLSLGVYLAVSGLLRELWQISDKLSASAYSDFFSLFSQKVMDFLSRFSLSEKLYISFSSFTDGFNKALSSLAAQALPAVIKSAMTFVSFFPSAVIFLCFMFIAVFYTGCDYEKICSFFALQLPGKWLDTLDETKNALLQTALELFKSYFLLTFITFLQLFIGFTIIGTEYAILLAAIICLVDLLPILGTGTVLVPWAIVCFIMEDVRSGGGLLVLYATITLFRQLIQPKIIGSGTNLSPLVSLIAIYTGLKTCGFWGIIIFPIIASTIVKLNREGLIHLYKNPPASKGEAIRQTRKKFISLRNNDFNND